MSFAISRCLWSLLLFFFACQISDLEKFRVFLFCLRPVDFFIVMKIWCVELVSKSQITIVFLGEYRM